MAKGTDKPIIGAGGVTKGEDIIEYMMAGASAVQIGSHALFRGTNSYKKIETQASKWLDEHGYKALGDVKGIALDSIGVEKKRYQMGFPDFDLEKCTSCMQCVKTCPYQAIYTMKADRSQTPMHRIKLYPRLDRRVCEACGWCASICPVWAITMTEAF
ncbi:MAG: 4Fe-4S binding protein [Candidatus Ranarchaeia archaeon]